MDDERASLEETLADCDITVNHPSYIINREEFEDPSKAKILEYFLESVSESSTITEIAEGAGLNTSTVRSNLPALSGQVNDYSKTHRLLEEPKRPTKYGLFSHKEGIKSHQCTPHHLRITQS